MGRARAPEPVSLPSLGIRGQPDFLVSSVLGRTVPVHRACEVHGTFCSHICCHCHPATRGPRAGPAAGAPQSGPGHRGVHQRPGGRGSLRSEPQPPFHGTEGALTHFGTLLKVTALQNLVAMKNKKGNSEADYYYQLLKCFIYFIRSSIFSMNLKILQSQSQLQMP